MRRPETVAAPALVVGQPLGPRSVALPGRTRTGLTAICDGWPEVGAVPLADAGVLGAAGGGGWGGGAGGTMGGGGWGRLGGGRGRHDGRGVLVGVAPRAATTGGRAAAARRHAAGRDRVHDR